MSNARVDKMGGRIRQSICRWVYKDIPIDELCEIARRIGYAGIDLATPDEFPTLKRHGMIGTMTPTHSIEKGLNREENWDHCLGRIADSIQATAAEGFPNVICFSGNVEGMDRRLGIRNCAAAIGKIISDVEKHKLLLCMELLNSKVDHPDYMCDRTAWGLELVDAVGSDHFKLLYDIYHMQIMEGDICATIQKHHRSFGHYHTGGVPGRHEIDGSQELHYPAIMQAIAETGFKGFVGQEFIPVNDPVESLRQGFEICDV